MKLRQVLNTQNLAKSIMEDTLRIEKYSSSNTGNWSKEMLDLWRKVQNDFSSVHREFYIFPGDESEKIFLDTSAYTVDWQEDKVKYAVMDGLVELVTDPELKGIRMLSHFRR